MEKSHISRFFSDIASLLELKGENPFRIRSDQKVAMVIENFPERLEDVYKKGGLKALEEIEGVGKHSALRIEEIVRTGKLQYYNKLTKEFPKGLLDILKIQGVGPKLASAAYKKLGIINVEGLLAAAKSGRLRGLPGVRDKKIENIIKGIEGFRTRSSKHFLGEVLPYAETITSLLKKSGFAGKVLICGSLRRMKETIGDIDILATSSQPEKISGHFTKLKQVKQIVAKGPTKSSVVLDNGMDAGLGGDLETVSG